MVSDAHIREEILKQTAEKASVAPRDIAQALATGDVDWRKFLPRIRQQATTLYGEKQLVFVRKRKIVPPEGLKGVFRLARPDSQTTD